MTTFKSILFTTLFSTLLISSVFAQQTYMAAAQKMAVLLDTKLLKTGEIVLIEQIRLCRNTRVKLLNPNGSEEVILGSGLAKFYSFNELEDNNWVLILITDPADDVPVPYTFHSITFIDGNYTVFNTDDDQIPISLESISASAVINGDELVLDAQGLVYFTDFQLLDFYEVFLEKQFSIMKSPSPSGSAIYYRYEGEDEIATTDDRFESQEIIVLNLGDSFRDIHYMGDYVIFQDEEAISVAVGIFGFYYLTINTKIYNFRQHGQNLTYHTLSPDNILTFNKIYLDEDEVLQKDSFDIDLTVFTNINSLHWDGDFKGLVFNFVPLPNDVYDDEYRGFNYVLTYNLQDFNLSTQNLDVSIEDIEYTTSVDTISIGSGISIYYADIEMQITVSNNTDQFIDDVHLHSAAFEGINCAHNSLKVDEDIIAIGPNESKVVKARYESLEFDSESLLTHPLCVYAIGANNKFDDSFIDNIYCLPLSEFTSSTKELEESGFAVYPNPAFNNIRIDSDTPNSSYLIYSIHGQKVIEWNSASGNKVHDISSLEKGTYLMIEQKTNKTRLFLKL